MVEFNIIEQSFDESLYSEYIRLYNEGVVLREIGERLNLSHSVLNRFYHHALDDELITPRNNGNSKCKYYSRHGDGYTVYSPLRNGKQSSFGNYGSEEEAQFVVDELIKVNWNRKCLDNIRLKACEKFK